MLLAVGGEPRSVEGIVPEAPDRASLALSDTSENDHVTDVVKDTKYWDSPSNATIKGIVIFLHIIFSAGSFDFTRISQS